MVQELGCLELFRSRLRTQPRFCAIVSRLRFPLHTFLSLLLTKVSRKKKQKFGIAGGGPFLERKKKKRRRGGKEERKRGKERRKGGEGKGKKERENMQIV